MHDKWLARNPEEQGLKYKLNCDLKVVPHKFNLDQNVWLSDTTALGNNPKLTPKSVGPFKIMDINDNNAKIELKPKKFKIFNISRLKAFQEETNKHLSQDAQHLSQGNPNIFED